MTERIKLVVSDFHLGTGRRNPDGSRNIMENFMLDERFVEFLEYYSSGDYTNTEVELIINGDFFNLIQGEVDGRIPSDITEDIVLRQLQDILNGHTMVFDALRAFIENPGKTLTFTVGNHDAGLIWTEAKKLLQERLGENVQIFNRAYVFDNVHIEHGDRFEPVHYVDPKLPILSRGLPEPILNIPWATYFYIHFVCKLKNRRAYIDKVKPFRHYLTWSAIFDLSFFIVTITKLIFFYLYTIFFAKVGHRRFGWPVIPMLLNQTRSFPELRAVRHLLKKEKIGTVILGHTHHALYRQWSGEGEYLNAGCWNGVTNMDIQAYGFQVRLTYVILEWEKERWVSNLRRWRGSAQAYEDFYG